MTPVLEFEKAIRAFGVYAAMDYFATPEEHKDGIWEAVNESAIPASTEQGEGKDDADSISLKELLAQFHRVGFDTSNWDGDEGAEKAIVDGVCSQFEQDKEKLFDTITDQHLEICKLKNTTTPSVSKSVEAKESGIRSALERLVHLHLCEQEGLSSGQPTPAMWLEAVDNASNALSASSPLPSQGVEEAAKEIKRLKEWCRVLYTDGAKSKLIIKGVTEFDYRERLEIESGWEQFKKQNNL